MTQSEGYRVSRLRQHSGQKKRKKTVAILVAVAVLVLGVASLFIFGVVHVPSWGSKSPDQGLSFLTNPASSQAIDAASVNILILTYEDRDPSRPITNLLVAGYGLQMPGAEFYSLPADLLAHTSEGKNMKLSEALKYGGGKVLLASSEVQRILGEQVHYCLLLKETETARVAETLGLPQKNAEEPWSSYLPGTLAGLHGLKLADLADRAAQAAGAFEKSPSFSSSEQQAIYIADIFKGFAELLPAQVSFREVPGVEILNGCGAPGIGERAQKRLEDYGFPVKDSGRNAKKIVEREEVNDFSYEKSVIHYHAADARVEAYARYLQAVLSVQSIELREDAVLGEGTVTLIVGKDLVGAYSAAEAP